MHDGLLVLGKLGSWLILLVQTYGQKQSSHTVIQSHILLMADSKQTQGKEEVGEKKGCKLEGTASYLIQRISKKDENLAAHNF